ERGQPMKVVILCGQDPLLFMLAGIPMPEISELDIAGGLRGEPIDVVRGPYTGFPIPADCEIAIEGETVPGETKPEGPFGEWMGYYSDDTQERPFVRVKTILHRNDPILTCAPQHKPGRPRALPRFKSVSAIPAMPARRCTSPAPAKVAPMPASGRLSSMMTSMPATSISCCGRCARGSIPRSTSISCRKPGRRNAIRFICRAISTIAS